MNLTSRYLRRVFSSAVAVTAAAVGVIAAAAPAQAASWQYHQLDSDPCWDAISLDTDYNGQANQVSYDADNDCRWDIHSWNLSGSDALHERMSFDSDEDGRAEVMLAETNQINGFDWYIRDYNDDGYWDTGWLAFSPTVLTIDMARSAVNFGSNGTWVYNPYM